MSDSLKPTITKRRDIRGKRIVGYRATLGQLSADGDTPQTATQALTTQALSALDRLSTGGRVSAWLDATTGRVRPIVVMPTLDGWGYWLDFLSSPFIYGSYATRDEAERTAHHHLAQNAWTPDVDDAVFLGSLVPSIRGDMARWIGFQRAYIRERQNGTPQHLIHQIACERPELIAVPA